MVLSSVTHAGHVILQLILYKLWSKTLLQDFQPYKLPILTSQFLPAWRVTPRYGVTPYLIFNNKQDIKDFLVFLTFSHHWETIYKPHCQQCWVQFTHAGHVILQLILYKLWSKTLLQDFQPYKLPILTSQLHPAWRVTPRYGVTPYLIFNNKQDIKDFLVFLTFSYHWETIYKPHCQQCWVQFTHAGHVILQLILYKLWSKTLLQDFQPYKLPILTSQLHPAWRTTPWYGVTPLPYL